MGKDDLVNTVEFRALLDEVLCTESAVSMETDGEEELNRWPTPTPDDVLFRSTTSRFFCGQGRCASPFGKDYKVVRGGEYST